MHKNFFVLSCKNTTVHIDCVRETYNIPDKFELNLMQRLDVNILQII